MKVEFIKESQDGQVIRLFDFNELEVREFKRLIDRLANGEINSFPLHEHCNINPRNNCHLTFIAADSDQGIRPKGAEFECVLTGSSLSQISELAGSFAFAPAEGYEWLDETSDIALLISPHKRW